jgi:ABC-type uncharacterized transport system permease subunit
MVLNLLTLILYIGAAFSSGLRLFDKHAHKKAISLSLAFAAIAVHLWVLSNSIFTEPGQDMSMTNVASLIAWIIAISMTLASLSIPNVLLLPVVYGFSALIVMLNLLIPDSYIMQIEVKPVLVVHITLALFAYGCLIIALLYALQLSYISNKLKQKQASLLHSSLPPLMVVEQVFFKLLLVGTVLLTLSLISGFVFLEDMFAKEQAHKTALSILAWMIFCFVLVSHQRGGFRGKPMVSATIVGAVLLTLAYFGSRFVREILLG